MELDCEFAGLIGGSFVFILFLLQVLVSASVIMNLVKAARTEAPWLTPKLWNSEGSPLPTPTSSTSVIVRMRVLSYLYWLCAKTFYNRILWIVLDAEPRSDRCVRNINYLPLCNLKINCLQWKPGSISIS